MKKELASTFNGIAIVILGIASLIYGIKYGKLQSELSILKEQQQELTVQLRHLQGQSTLPDSICTKVEVLPWSRPKEDLSFPVHAPSYKP